MDDISALAALIERHAPQDGSFDTALPRIGLVRSSSTTEPLHTLYEPSCCIAAQGRKRATVGGVAYVYEPAQYLVVGVDLPVIGAVVEASPGAPYLCLRIEIDRRLVAEMLEDRPPLAEPNTAAIGLSDATPQLIDAAVRLLRLLDEPADRAVLGPLFERELMHRLLSGSQAGTLHRIAHGASRLNRVRKAVAYLREHYAEPVGIDQLAAEADMAVSTFHAHFQAATTMSPLQFRTMLRMQEARRLMIADDLGAAEAGFRVGYESPSQFSRDYLRTFRASPRTDVRRMREARLAGAGANA
ncbi:AraC family transcriptional regulator [soil metagenome]